MKANLISAFLPKCSVNYNNLLTINTSYNAGLLRVDFDWSEGVYSLCKTEALIVVPAVMRITGLYQR